MLINGTEVDFKISRPKDAAAFEKALQDMADREIVLKEGRKTQELSGIISDTITMFQEFIKTATGVDALKDCDDLETAQEAYYQFCDEVTDQKKKFLAPYSPARIK